MDNRIVEIRRIKTEKWHRLKDDQDITRPIIICPRQVGMKYDTGLTETERVDLEAKTGFDLSLNYNINKPHPFWDSKMAALKLKTAPVLLQLTNPLDFIKYKIALQHPNVATSLDEYEEGLFPSATHYIFDEKIVLEKKASKLQKRNKAITALNKLGKTTKVSMIQIINKKPVANLSNEFIELEMEKILTDHLDKFLALNLMKKDEIFIRAIIMEALFKGILIKDGSAIQFMGDRLGIDFDDTVLYLSKDENNEIKARILSNLNSLEN
jgi:hypothetical protein